MTATDPRPDAAAAAASSRAIEESLRGTLRVLKVAVLALLAVFALTGVYFVEEGSVAVRTRFGAILGSPGRQVIEPGGPHFALPEPMDRVVRIPTTLAEVSIDRAFWFEEPGGRGGPLEERFAPRSLAPGRHGSLLTGKRWPP